MESILFGLVPLVIGIALLFSAFRAHERYWALGFMGWRRVYAGLVLFLFSGILTAIWPWTSGSGLDAVGRLILWQITSALAAAAGIGLVLAGAIERLHEFSDERERLNDVRAGFDLFDSLREITSQPYAFLEILDFSLKEIVRAAGVECGGVWLYNPGRSEWVLTGWAGMSEKLRQQTESVRGSGTGFDRLALTHKARLFRNTEDIRVFFPEWEPEGFQSILGLPLATGTIGTPGRQLLGVIVLADRSPAHFDDDRARRLYAASDYIAAVIAEARITRQLEAARQQLESAHAEWERDRLDVQNQREAREERVQEMQSSWEEEKRALELDIASRLSTLQAKADAEVARTREESERDRQEFQRQHQIADETLQQAKNEWNHERRSLEENLAAQIKEVHARTKEEIDQVRTEYDRRAAAAAAAEQERTSQLQQRWEDARRDYESALGRFENERAEWGRRLDQLNQDHQGERDVARKHEEQLTAAHREALAASQQRIDELQSLLTNEQQKLARERDALESASHSVADLESALTTERIEHEALMAGMTARIEDERRVAVQDKQAAGQELHAARQLLEEREKQLSSHLVAARQTAAEAQSHYQETLESQRQATECVVAGLHAQLANAREYNQSAEQELRSTRLMFDEREKEFLGRIDAERQAFKDLETTHTEDQTADRLQFTTDLRNREEQLLAASVRVESLEAELRTALEEKAADEARARQELVEQHLHSRRQINAVKTRRDELTERLQIILGLSEEEERLSALFRSLSEDLPAPVQLYLWQRDAEHGVHLAAWMDRDRNVHRALDLPPWSFEVETIPAEGVTRFIGSQQWEETRRVHDDAHCARWQEHWGSEDWPTWVTCWPWRMLPGKAESERAYTTGWLTACGFGPQEIDDDQVVHGGQWIGFLAAAAIGMKATPVSVSSENTDGAASGIPAPQGQPQESPEDLNNVILDWAANQTEDALRLELSAQSKVEVEPSWLRDLLDRGRRLCRSGESQGSEFSVTTESHNGHTVLRLVRSSVQSEAMPSGITAVDDSDLTGMQVSALSVPGDTGDEQTAGSVSVAGRWLIHDGDRLGLELHFANHVQDGDPGTSDPAELESASFRDILVVNFQNAMNELVVGMLESLGHRVRSADIATAPDMISMQGSDLAIVAATPEASGWDFAHWLKDTIPALPVIVVTDDEPPPANADTACDQTLRIPFQIEELQRNISMLTAREAVHQIRE